MTGRYERNSMPHQVNVKCPRCKQCAEFEFAAIRRIELKADIEFFKNSPVFEYRKLQGRSGHAWHGAIYFPGLHGKPELAIHALPDAYQPSDWDHSQYFLRSCSWDLGSVRCLHCHFRAKHTLNWADEAYFSITYKNHVLWAFNEESAAELNDYLRSKTRDLSKYRWHLFLLHIPTMFKTKKAREAVSKQLLRLLNKSRAMRKGTASAM